MVTSSEVSSKFFEAFEKVISRNRKSTGEKTDDKSIFQSFFSTMESVANNLKSNQIQPPLKKQESSAPNLFGDFSLSLEFQEDENVLSPRMFGALYEHYCNRSDLAAFYSSGDVAAYITATTIGSWILERLCEGKIATKALKQFDIESNQNLDYLKVVNDIVSKGDRNSLEAISSLLKNITVLDPTCGCGSFYFAALDILLDLNLKAIERLKRRSLSSTEKRKLFNKIISQNLYGVDIDANAIEVIRFQVKMYQAAFAKTDVDSLISIQDNLQVGDALLGPPFVGEAKELADKKMFDWRKAFPLIVGRKGFDIVIGNPPYLEFEEATTGDYSKTGMITSSCRDLYALTMERSLQIISSNGRLGFIVPISAYSSPRFRNLRTLLAKDLDKIWVASFANRPAQLFKGAQKRLNIIMGRKGNSAPTYFTSEYIRWKSEERSRLFADRVKFVENPLIDENADLFFKSGCAEDIEILKKLENLQNSEPWASHSKPAKSEPPKERGKKIYFTRAFGYFLYFLDFIVEYRQIKTGAKVLPSEFHCLEMANPRHTSAAIAVLNSSLFYWFLSQTTDCRNVNFKEVLDFPLDFSKFDDLTMKRLSNAGDKLLKKLKSSSFRTQKSGLQIQTFDYLSCLSEIEDCDSIVLNAYGISGKHAARVRSFDAKYRFSKEGKRRIGEAA